MMVGKDVMEMWEIVNPMGVLQSVIQKQQHGDIESRLCEVLYLCRFNLD